MKPSQILLPIAIFSTLSSAWPWSPFGGPEKKGVAVGIDSLARRQGKNSNSASATTASAPKATPSQSFASSTAVSDNGSQTSNQASKTSKETGSSGKSTGAAHTTKAPKINPEDPPGGLSMIQPPITLGSQYYRAGENITLVWNYTSLQVTPTAIDIFATMASTAGGYAPSPFTLALNESLQKTQTYIWDTASILNNAQLPVGLYTLVVYDADAAGGATAIPSPGYLGAYSQFSFGVYTHQPVATAYPDSQRICVTCNAAEGKMAMLAWGLMVGLASVTMGGFVLL